ncbi:5'-3' exonuclease [Novilysobacter ciconiae]|uniref:5'-3' exonuclease n=1 Tax=Novilysobacter ciconiae TaxID=2781022 RepID=UPI001D1675A2|nr:5'-3' exonuclease H3TH domain-containing protein [Lysobacter ciconiae]
MGALSDAGVAASPRAATPTLYLVDASLYVFRAWHSMPDDFRGADGSPTNAVHGFARFLLELLDRARPQHIAVAFDEALDSCFRNAIYPAYKANREPAPDALKRQFVHCRELCAALGLSVLSHPEYEADDLIGSACVGARAQRFRSVIVSADKDLSQLLAEDDEQWDFARGQRWGADGVPARHGVEARQMADYLALTGDAVDNIPGVPGIGAKTAAALLTHFGSLDALLERIDEVPYLRLRGAAACAARLREHRDLALLCRRLSTVACDVVLDDAGSHFIRESADSARLHALCERVRFGPMTRRRLYGAAGLEFNPGA